MKNKKLTYFVFILIPYFLTSGLYTYNCLYVHTQRQLVYVIANCLLAALILFFLPYEHIKEKYNDKLGFRIYCEVVIVEGIIWLISGLEYYLHSSFFIPILVLATMYTITQSFILVHNEIKKNIICAILIIATSCFAYIFTQHFMLAFLIFLGLNIGWYVLYLSNKSNSNKVKPLLCFFLLNCFAGLIGSWLCKDNIQLEIASAQQNLSATRHIFDNYKYMNILILLLLSVMGIFIYKCKRILSKRRFAILILMYCSFASSALYLILGNLAIVPKTGENPINLFTTLSGTAILIRLFFPLYRIKAKSNY